MKTRDFSSDEEIRSLVEAFEAGKLPPAEFKHSAHIAVGLAYLSEAPVFEATVRMRESLHRFLTVHNETGYHETLTVFWMRLLAHLASFRYFDLPLWQRVNAVVENYNGRWPIVAHYSTNLIDSQSARETWVEPDLVPLPPSLS